MDAFFFGEAIRLNDASIFDALSDSGGGFSDFGGGERFVIDQRHIDMEIDSVEQWSTDALAVLLNDRRSTAALAFQIAIVTARTRSEARGIANRHRWKCHKALTVKESKN